MVAVGEPGEEPRHRRHREGENERAAPVDAEPYLVGRDPGHGGDVPQVELLQRVRGVDVLAHLPTGGDARCQHRAVLAGAVVVQRRRLHAAGHQRAGGRLVQRGVRPAEEVLRAEADPPEEPARRLDVERLAAVGAARQRQLGVGHREAVGGAGEHGGERLDRLRRGAEEHRRVHVARRGDQPSLAPDRHADSVVALDDAGAGEQDAGRFHGGDR